MYFVDLFKLLRMSVGNENSADILLSADDWHALYEQASRQALIGIIFGAVKKLDADHQPPFELAMEWMSKAETISGMNRMMNEETAKLTQLFEAERRRTAILKGQANALLYPDPSLRQSGDIDIWVEGGRESVIQLVDKMGLLSEKAAISTHHVHLPPNERGITVEIHFHPTSNANPMINRRVRSYLEQEILSSKLCSKGFYVPSMKFALVMQLSHIQRHFISTGVGLRQLTDYYLLLSKSTEEERLEVSKLLSKFDLLRTARALMGLLCEVFHIDKDLMLCPPDVSCGKWMLREIMDGGNFGKHYKHQQHGFWKSLYYSKRRRLKMIRFAPSEVIFGEMKFWLYVIKTLPKRIRHLKFSLNDIPK